MTRFQMIATAWGVALIVCIGLVLQFLFGS